MLAAQARVAPVVQDEVQYALGTITRIALFISYAFAATLPHSFQLVEALAFVATTALCAVVVRRDPWLNQVLITYCLGVIVTAIYIWVGYVNGAPRVATGQIFFVYIIAPLMWIMMGTAAIQLMGLRGTIRMLLWLTCGALVTVAAFFILFFQVGRGAVEFLSADANINVNDGFAAANILVYGSLIFLTGAVFAQPAVIPGKWGRAILPGALAVCALTSGRSALILSIPVGLLIGALMRPRGGTIDERGRRRNPVLSLVLVALLGVAVLAALDFFLASIDLFVILERFFDKIASGGGSERVEQSVALWEGFIDSRGLGIGHGKGVFYIRSNIYPWRYEVMPLATLVHAGLIGLIAYMAPFILYGRKFLQRMSAGQVRPEDVYMLGGFASVTLAAATNPYIESFVFLWMYFLPVMAIAIAPVDRRAA